MHALHARALSGAHRRCLLRYRDLTFKERMCNAKVPSRAGNQHGIAQQSNSKPTTVHNIISNEVTTIKMLATITWS